MDKLHKDPLKKKSSLHPLDEAGFIKQLFFGWMFPYIWTGHKRDLTLGDMPDEPSNDERCSVISKKLISYWDTELALLKQDKKPSLARAALKTFSWRLFTNSFISIFAETICRTIQAYSVGQILHFIYERNIVKSDPLLLDLYSLDNPLVQWTLTLIISTACWVLTAHLYGFKQILIGIHLRAACSHLIYRKALKLSQNSLGRSTIGQMVNLLSNDLDKFNIFCVVIPFLWIGPMQTILSLYLIWPLIGSTILGVLAILAILLPILVFMSFKFGSYRGKIARATDKRVRLVNEIISSLRLIKAYAWEYACRSSMEKARKEETNLIFRVNQLRGLHNAVSFISGKCIIFVTIIFHCVIFEQPLTSQVLFICIAMLSNIQFSMTRLLPIVFSTTTEAYISIERINDFLLVEERQDDSKHLIYAPALTSFKPAQAASVDKKLNLVDNKFLIGDKPDVDDYGVTKCRTSVEMTNVFAKWACNTSDTSTLKNVSLKVETGKLTIICGPVASGKSSLFLALLNELPIEAGQARVHGQIGYVSQEAWIFAGTVRDNIVFGAPFNSKLYWEIIRVCALERDLQLFEFADHTYINDKGVSLSGGQKARISLARSLYRNCDVYLLDDPLSAVDAHVQSHIFQQAIKGFLADKTVLLATHQLHYLKQADQIVVMKQGEIVATGTYGGIRANEKIDYLINIRDNDTDDDLDISTSTSKDTEKESTKSKVCDEKEEQKMIRDANLQKPEQESMGREFASPKIWWQYFTAASTWRFLLLVVVYIMTQVIYSSIDVYLTVWTVIEQQKGDRLATMQHDSNQSESNSIDVPQDGSDLPMIYRPWYSFEAQLNTSQLGLIYTGLIIGLFTFACFRNSLLYANNSRTANILYRKLFESALFSRIAFFDKNPIGRFLNRATSDIGMIDELLPVSSQQSFEIILMWLASITLVALVDITMVLPSSIVFIAFIYVHQIYIRPARDMKRLETIVKSPILSHLATTLNGLTTIRASNVESNFEDQFIRYQDRHSSVYLLFWGCNRWLATTLDWINWLFISSISAWAVYVGLDGSSSGLVITNGILLCCMAQAGIMNFTDTESMMVCIERVSEYSKLPQEDQYDDTKQTGSEKQKTNNKISKLTKDNVYKLEQRQTTIVVSEIKTTSNKQDTKSDCWPKSGSIEYRNVCLYYDDIERPVLKDLTFKIESGEKVGIVGRTGAGKSSLLTTLFRLYDFSGNIFLDGVDSKALCLKHLRSSISIIPQDPVLFTDTVRLNVDPFSNYDDTSVWRALELAHLKEAVLDMNHGLNSRLSERGGNLSVGQRQLMCLARALLKRNHILVMDEATANVDPDTDEIIQSTVRREFSDWTVLIIAHRLNTIIDCDRVIVMDAGRIAEMDSPFDLINKPGSLFALMLASTGKSNEEKLRTLAKQAYDLKKRDQQDACDNII